MPQETPKLVLIRQYVDPSGRTYHSLVDLPSPGYATKLLADRSSKHTRRWVIDLRGSGSIVVLA